MDNCKTCMKSLKNGLIAECKNCGQIYCTSCAKKTKKICPKCYNNLELTN